MDLTPVPAALATRLGPDATAGLLERMDDVHQNLKADVIALSTERFERRLAEELAKLRVEMAQGLSAVRQEIAIGRVESIRWSFLFWIGQVLAMVGILATLLRSAKP